MATALILGGGGREHALGCQLAQLPQVDGLYFAPGNPGTLTFSPEDRDFICQNWPGINPTDAQVIGAFAADMTVDLVVPGENDSLAAGVVDAVRAQGGRAFGPTQAAARLESSKIFAGRFMDRWHNTASTRSGL